VSAPTADDPHGGVRQIVVPPVAWMAFENLCSKAHSVLVLLPSDDPDDLPTYVIHPRAAGDNG
jgi:hypothetical protein